MSGTPHPLHAQTTPPQAPLTSPFEIDPVLDGVLTAGLLSLVGIYRFGVEPSLPRDYACGGELCDPSDLNPMDRWVLDRRSEPWALFSDAILAVVAVLPLGAISLDVLLSDSPSMWKDLATELLLFAETLGVSLSLYTIVAQAVGRPRPNHYQPGRGVSSPQSLISFPSGHGVVAASAAVGYATILGYRHPGAWWRWPIYAGAATLVALNSWGRLEDARHFPTDIIAGLVMGAVVGFLVPYLHLVEEELSSQGAAPLHALQFAPWVQHDGGGLQLGARF